MNTVGMVAASSNFILPGMGAMESWEHITWLPRQPGASPNTGVPGAREQDSLPLATMMPAQSPPGEAVW